MKLILIGFMALGLLVLSFSTKPFQSLGLMLDCSTELSASASCCDAPAEDNAPQPCPVTDDEGCECCLAIPAMVILDLDNFAVRMGLFAIRQEEHFSPSSVHMGQEAPPPRIKCII